MKPILDRSSIFVIMFVAIFCVHSQENFEHNWKANYEKGLSFLQNKNAKEAVPFFKLALETAKQNPSINVIVLDSLTYTLANTLKATKDYKEAITYYEESIKTAKNSNNDSLYIKRLSETAQVHKLIEDYESGIRLLNTCKEFIAENQGTDNISYANTLLELSILYKRLHEYKNAILVNEISIDIKTKLFSENSSELIGNFITRSQIYDEQGSYDKAINALDRAFNLFSEESKKSTSYAAAIFTKALLYEKLKDFENAIKLYEDAKDILGSNHSHYTTANVNIAQAYTDFGDYKNAMKYSLEVLNKTSPQEAAYANRLQNLAFLYVKLGNYDKGKKYYEMAQAKMLENNKENDLKYGKLLNNIGKMYHQIGELEKAKSLFKKALDIFLLTNDENHVEYGYQLNDYANTLFELNQVNDAIDLLKKNLVLSEKNNRQNLQEYNNWQYNLGSAYNKLQKFDQALPLLMNASKNTQEILGNDHIIYGKMLKDLGIAYLGKNDVDSALPKFNNFNSILKNEINKVFKFRSENEKKAFLNIVKQNFEELQSLPITTSLTNNSLNTLNLENQLMIKGLLLNNSKNLLTELEELNNPSIYKESVHYRFLKTQLSKALSQPINDRTINIDSLKEVINNVESKLVSYHNESNNNVELEKDWIQTKENLKDNAIAIEFSNFNLYKNGKTTDSLMYVAYVYKSNSEYPKMIPLFEQQELSKLIDTFNINELYQTNALYSLILKPLEEYINGVNTIYYSPSGLLNQIQLAAITNNTQSIADQFNLVQLSSTANLANKLSEPNFASVLFVGGVDYDYTETVTKEADSNTIAYLDINSIRGFRASKSRGESWKYLPGTLMEINQLQNIINTPDNEISTLTGNKATETSFKKLSGNSPNIIHIATHGFFFENQNIKPRYGMNLSAEDQYRLAEDPLLRSGIMMAGANYAWKHGSNPMEDDDGILTAMEISNLDLSNTDMVVLSACETGLGDIEGSEGVYGLQRAFKMAGVKIIVMSLWQVPDKETAEFMTLFYSKWKASNNVREAFNITQRSMQHKYKEEPEKWAAFVLFE